MKGWMGVNEKQQYSMKGVKRNGTAYVFYRGRGVYNLSWELFDVCVDRNGGGEGCGRGEWLI